MRRQPVHWSEKSITESATPPESILGDEISDPSSNLETEAEEGLELEESGE